MAHRPTVLGCQPCRLKGKPFHAPYTPAGERKMDRHLATHHPRKD